VTRVEEEGRGEEGIYLFCFARRGALPGVAGPGLDEQSPVFLRAFREVVAVLCRAPLKEFCGPSGEAHLRDLTWVGPRACRHEEVIERAMRRSPVFPARFGTLFSSVERLEGLLEAHYDTVSGFLDSMIDREEWGVKGLLCEAEAERHLLDFPSDLPPSPGARYLLERRRRAEADRRLRSWAEAVGASVTEDLQRRAVACRGLRAVPRDVSGRDARVAFNLAFLLLRSAREAFRLRVEQLSAEQAARGMTLELSGPWPPYSFCPSLAPFAGAAREAKADA
jgi:hypothetical protein